MPTTPNYGFEYETPGTLPGVTVTGGPSGTSPILASQVDSTLVGIDNRVAGAEANITAIENTLVGFEPVYARAVLSGNFSMATGTVTVIQLNTVVTTSQPMWNAGTFRFVIPINRGGFYLITACVCYAANSTGVRSCDILVNDERVTSELNGATGSGNVRVTSSTLTTLNAGDEVWFTGFQNSGGALNVAGDNNNPTHLAITRLAPL